LIWFVAKRLGSAVLVMFAISVMVFLIFFATPGVDPAARIAGRGASPEVLAQVQRTFGFDQPLPVRYLLMMDHLFIRQDLTSYVNVGEKVVPQILAAAPVTLSLVIGAAVIWIVLGLGGGVLATAYRDTVVDPVIMIIGIAAISMPAYWVGEVVNLITQDKLHSTIFSWVPSLGYVSITQPLQWASHLILPWLTLALLYGGIYARVVRAELITAMSEDYVRTGRAKGLSEHRILWRHALRGSLSPVVSLFGLDFGSLVGGAALLTEVVFGLPGIGKLTWDSLQNLDLPVIMACVLYSAFFVVAANAVVDLLYAVIDPRVRHA
jgi:peptide/nickel transport system permease protein